MLSHLQRSKQIQIQLRVQDAEISLRCHRTDSSLQPAAVLLFLDMVIATVKTVAASPTFSWVIGQHSNKSGTFPLTLGRIRGSLRVEVRKLLEEVGKDYAHRYKGCFRCYWSLHRVATDKAG